MPYSSSPEEAIKQRLLLEQYDPYLRGKAQANFPGVMSSFETFRQQKQQEAAQQLQNYLTLSQIYPNMAPPQSVQQAVGTMFPEKQNFMQKLAGIGGQLATPLTSPAQAQLAQQQAQLENAKSIIAEFNKGGATSKSRIEPTMSWDMNKGLNVGFKSKDTSAQALKDELRQDRLEKTFADRLMKVVSYRSGGLGLQDSKVNQAIDLRTMLDQNFDPATGNYNIPPSLHSELALGLARLLSPTGQVAVEMEQQLRQKTAREGLAGALIYLGFDPKKVGGSTQGVINMFADSIDRQGETAEKLRDKYFEDIRNLAPSDLEEGTMERLKGLHLGSSYRKYKQDLQDSIKSSATSTPKNKKELAINRANAILTKNFPNIAQMPKDEQQQIKQKIIEQVIMELSNEQ